MFGQEISAQKRIHSPSHLGGIIKEAIQAIPMSVIGFAAHSRVSRVTLFRVLNETAGVMPEMSINISEAFGRTRPVSGSIFRTITTSGMHPMQGRAAGKLSR